MDSSSFAYVDKAKSDLEAAKRVLNEEINAYPTPIAGCDEQPLENAGLIGIQMQCVLKMEAGLVEVPGLQRSISRA